MSLMRLMRYVLLIVFFLGLLFAQDTTRIYGVSLDIKRNGLFIQVRASQKIDITDVTGWQAKNKWFYITVMDAWADSVKITSAKALYPVQEIQAININNTVQIGFKLNQEIEHFEFYPSDITPGMILSLHFPVDDVMVALEEERKEGVVTKPVKVPVVLSQSITSSIDEQLVPPDNGYSNIRNSCYLFGVMFTASGMIESNSKHRSNVWETTAGLSVIVLTYSYDKFVRKERTTFDE